MTARWQACLGVALMASMCAPAFAQLSLTADSEPVEKAWKSPATLAYTRAGDHSSSTAIDAYLEYKLTTIGEAPTLGAPVSQDTKSLAAYLHKNNSGATRKNDRGVAVGYSRLIVDDSANDGPPMSIAWHAKLSVGKTEEQLEASDPLAPPRYDDKTKDRQRLFLSGFWQPKKKGPVPRDDAARAAARPMDMYLLWTAGVYSDHSSGGNGVGTGRLSGTMASLQWDILPLGMVAADNRIGGYGVAPVLTLAAQVQRDASASGGRKKDTYRLYTASLTFELDTIVDTGGVGRLKPSLVISRSIGADLLNGRPYEGKTEVALGLTF